MSIALLTVSGNIDPDIVEKSAKGERPVADYLAMSRKFDATLLDYNLARKTSGLIGRTLEKVGGSNLMLAWACYRRRRQYPVILTDGEQVGIPLALITKALDWGRHPFHHLMIGHFLSVGKKMLFFDWFKVQSHIDTFFVYATSQKKFIEERWGISPERVVFTPFMVNTDFFTPEKSEGESPTLAEIRRKIGDEKPVICSVGLEFRDYETLVEAVRGLDVHLIIAAGSPWSKRSDKTGEFTLPENITIARFNQYELRQVYHASSFVVMPLYDVNFQAGVTALLEAMAMEKAVICSRSQGQTDVVVEGETGVYVPVGDVSEMRQAILQLLENPQLAKRMGIAGRRRIEQEMSLDWYVTRLSEHVQTSLCMQFLHERGVPAVSNLLAQS